MIQVTAALCRHASVRTDLIGREIVADLWEFIAGLGVFLFAMRQIETALKALGGRRLRLFFRQRMRNRLGAIVAGIVSTAALQSSSLVGLLVLAFVGAAMMPLESALCVVFGSNLGTTLTGWVVATVGFKLEIESLALPLMGLGSLVFVTTRHSMHEVARLAAALGFLLLGLSFMKESFGATASGLEVGQLADLALWQYLLVGVVVAGLVQSSSAVMVITLAALNASVIPLESAAAVVIGADLGTTSTLVIGAVQGASAKKRVALAHVTFNVMTDLVAFLLLGTLLSLVALLGLEDPLLSLVAFHSLFNLMGLLMFFPFVGLMAAGLERLFRTRPEPAAQFLRDLTPLASDAAVGALEKETCRLIAHVIRQNRHVFPVPLPKPPGRPPVMFEWEEEDQPVHGFDALYQTTKRIEGEVLEFTAQLQAQSLETADTTRVDQLLSAVRHAVRSSKNLKDVKHNLLEFEDSPNPIMNGYAEHFRSVSTTFQNELYRLRQTHSQPVSFEDMVAIRGFAFSAHEQLHQEIYKHILEHKVRELEISSLLNVNRELLMSNLYLITALTELHLNPSQADAFSQLPTTA